MEDLKRLHNLLLNTNKEILNKSMNDTHINKNFSLVFNGLENGKLTRSFIAHKKIKPFEAQLHSHCYDLKITVLKGEVKHHVVDFNKGKIKIPCYKYKSPLNGGDGLRYSGIEQINITEYIIPIGASIKLSFNDIHTISCSKNSIWIVEELGFKTNESIVLGVPFITDNLYNTPSQYQINDNYQLVNKAFKDLLRNI